MAKRKAISIKDVARESQASLTTVSLVLNRRARRISQATKDRVQETADRLGYRPSRLAQGLQAQRAGFLGILVPEIKHAFADVYFGEIISAIHDHASEVGWKIILEVAHPDYIQAGQHVELFDRHFIDGLLCLGVTDKDAFMRDFEDQARTVVVVNNYLPDCELDHVICDYRRAGRLAGRHLLDLGHRKIGLIRGASEVQTTWDLQRGLNEELAAHDGSLPDAQVEDGLYTEEGGAAAAIALLERNADLTAILAGNDKMAIGAISSLKQAGHRVPDDISVIGCDDLHQGAFCDPPLTTIHTPIYEVGQRACRVLLELIEGKVESARETLPVSLTVRKSTSPRKDADTGT